MKFRYLLLLLLSVSAYAVHTNDRSVYMTDVKSPTGISVFSFPTTRPTAAQACVYNTDGEITSSVTTLTEISYVSGATSNLQAQINAINAGNGFEKIQTVSTSTVLISGQNYTLVNCSTACTITLPVSTTVVVVMGGNSYSIPYAVKSIGAGAVTVMTQGGDLLDGLSSATLYFQYETLHVLPSSGEWNIL